MSDVYKPDEAYRKVKSEKARKDPDWSDFDDWYLRIESGVKRRAFMAVRYRLQDIRRSLEIIEKYLQSKTKKMKVPRLKEASKFLDMYQAWKRTLSTYERQIEQLLTPIVKPKPWPRDE